MPATEVSPTDLAALMESTDYFADYSSRSAGYKVHMGYIEKVRSGEAHRKLQKSQFARELVRAILEASSPAVIMGRDAGPYDGAVVFPEKTEKRVNYELHQLLNSQGLLDLMLTNGDRFPKIWCFQSEVVHSRVSWDWTEPCFEQTFQINYPLRDAVSDILAPFADEKPWYRPSDRG